MDILNCLVGEIKKKDDKIIITLVDMQGQIYGTLQLEDDFGMDIDSVDNVSLQKIYGEKK